MSKDINMRETAIREARRRKTRKVISSLMLILFIALLVLAVIAGIIAMVTAIGKSRLHNKVSEAKPNMMVEEINADNSEILSEQDAETVIKQPVHWEEGWVRYDGKIYEYNEDIMTFLVMGIDKEGKVKESKDAVSGGQSDALFLVVANPDDKSIKIIAVNRDTMTEVQMYGYGDSNQTIIAQIAVQHGFGGGLEKSCELTRDAVSKLFYDLPIHGYASINMGAISTLNDAVGGVEVTVLEDLTKARSAWNKGAQVTLHGRDAFIYTKWRDISVFESNRGRLARQKQYLNAFIARVKEATKENITLPITLYSELSKYMVTDINVDEVAYLASELMDYEFATDSIYTLEGITQMGEKHEEFYPDKDALKKLMIDVFYQEVNIEEVP